MKKSEIKSLLKERNSAKSFKTDFVISDEELTELGDIIRFSPVSMGLFSTRLVILKPGQLKDTFNQAFYDQTNYKTASAAILFVTDLEERIFNHTISKTIDGFKGHISDERIDARKNYVATSLGKKRNNDNYFTTWQAMQAHILLGVAVIAASEMGFDSCPLGGYSQKTVDKLARENNLIESNEQVAIALVIGKNNDNPEIYFKNRMDNEEFTTIVKDK